jgi:PIN domain nuclease of toxin-antitoxin system
LKKLLLDTHIFLWWIDDIAYKNIPPEIQSAIANPDNDVFVSIASLWEIGIKQSLGSLKAPNELETVIKEKGFEILSISAFHTEQVATMPFVTFPSKDKLHKDPFDRMLVAQAQAEGMFLVSADLIMPEYPVRLIRA